jgi:hypothetical protein
MSFSGTKYVLVDLPSNEQAAVNILFVPENEAKKIQKMKEPEAQKNKIFTDFMEKNLTIDGQRFVFASYPQNLAINVLSNGAYKLQFDHPTKDLDGAAKSNQVSLEFIPVMDGDQITKIVFNKKNNLDTVQSGDAVYDIYIDENSTDLAKAIEFKLNIAKTQKNVVDKIKKISLSDMVEKDSEDVKYFSNFATSKNVYSKAENQSLDQLPAAYLAKFALLDYSTTKRFAYPQNPDAQDIVIEFDKK